MTHRGLWSKVLGLALALVAYSVTRAALAEPLAETVARLGRATSAEVPAIVEELGRSPDARARRVLEAMFRDQLVIDERGVAYAETGGRVAPLSDPASGAPRGQRTRPVIDNRVRRVLLPTLARLQLGSSDASERLAAAEELAKHSDDTERSLIAAALARETDGTVKERLEMALARVDLHGSHAARRLAALEVIGSRGDLTLEPELSRVVADAAEPAAIKSAANQALGRIRSRASLYAAAGNLFYGLSLGSVLLLASLGLAITFGLMRVINMAHGEMLMLGAYATYVVQNLFQQHAPGAFDWYIALALPVAFLVCFAAGVVLERTVVRHLYGRPLETLLATWGISLIVIQLIRLSFGASNVTVQNPSFLSGGFALFPGVVLPYSRLAVVLFVVFVVGLVGFVLNRTPMGLQVRAITQNREMAAAMGIPTRRVDTWTFGLGSGVAGLGGVALSQLGNVGPELGQAYIVDAFMVVVLGGVGKLAGTIFGALGLGMLNKLVEPVAGAVLGKILILVIVILFIQKRPQGIFALKGRAAEA